MKNIMGSILGAIILASSVQTYALFNVEARAAQRYQQQEQAKMAAIKQQIISEDIEHLGILLNGIWYCIKATGKIVFLQSPNDTTETVIGGIGAAMLATAAGYGLYKLYSNSQADDNDKETIIIHITT